MIIAEKIRLRRVVKENVAMAIDCLTEQELEQLGVEHFQEMSPPQKEKLLKQLFEIGAQLKG